MRRPRVLLADDHRLLCEAFARLLEASCDVVGAVGDGRALLEAADRLRPDGVFLGIAMPLLEAAAGLRPDLIVRDIAMPLLNGLDAARLLKRDLPEIGLIVLTVNED